VSTVSRLVTTTIATICGIIGGALLVWIWARGEIGRRDDQLSLVGRTDDQWEEHLKSLTTDALSNSQSSLLELTDARLQPIKDTLDRFDEQARLLEEKRMAQVSAIPQLLQTVNDGQERLRKETGNLVTALRTPHVRGGWGEMQLKRVVEMAGMLAHCDFVEQASERDGEGRLLRPDLVVKLPGGKNIVVDSKAPLEAYLDALGTDDEAARREHLARHAKLVRDHVTKLGQKRYWQQFEPAPEFVVMFVDEGLFRGALDQDPSLFEAGVNEGVIIASPATLVALLRTVSYCWQQETVAESAREVSKLGRELYERLGVFGGHFGKIGRALDSAIDTYNKAVGSFETRVLVTARKFPELGSGGEELPDVPPVTQQARPLFAAELDTGADEVTRLPTRAA
jgi:DNA recombination protein RmuC